MIYSWQSLERPMNMNEVVGGELGGPCGRPAARPLPTSSPANPLGQTPVLWGCFLGIWVSPAPGGPPSRRCRGLRPAQLWPCPAPWASLCPRLRLTQAPAWRLGPHGHPGSVPKSCDGRLLPPSGGALSLPCQGPRQGRAERTT